MTIGLRRCLVLAALALGVSGTPALAQADIQTGLIGRVVIATRCPVPLADDDGTCPTQPLPGSVTVLSSEGTTEVAQVTTDEEGQFAVPLDPGQYTVIAADGVSRPVTVAPDQPTELTITVPRRVP